MTVRTYARITNGEVAEIVETSRDITRLYHPEVLWTDVTGQSVAVGDHQTPTGFMKPTLTHDKAPAPSFAALQTEIASLSARITALEALAKH